MYTKFLIILLLIFIVFNSQKLKEKFSNAFQDTEIRAKLSHFGTNLSEEKPLLTLYFDRREPNCKYFYDYFSEYHGFRDSEGTSENTGSRYSGKSQAWNQFKTIYADTDDENKYIKPDFLNIEEIEVKDGELYDFNNKPAYKIENNGYVQYIGPVDDKKPKEYKQYYKPDNFLDRIPKLVLSFFKHKSKEEIETIMEDLSVGNYGELKHFHKYDFYVIEYDGLYSPNNRQIKTTLDNIIQFINETYEEYLLCPTGPSHHSRIGNDTTLTGHRHEFNVISEKYIKCNKCSEFIKNED